ncbi:MAG: glycogen/starch/alpha-glucan phosphorylase [Clostridiales Family XIII bacterium]|jgi:starch phosphorylase|nr:glycogen/starch/alpha-glucan phosphorylase [Clostridiales Family XIII bacterium]
MFENKEQFVAAYKRKFMSELSKTLSEATAADKYVVLASMICEKINEKWVITNDYYLKTGARQVYYFSLEFLLGKFLESNLIYLGVEDVCREGLAELGIELDDLIRCEPDPALGNGGLGRLAACFLDSLASMGLPGHGNGIRYKYGLFRQQIVDGYQVELPDNWLNRRNPWEIRKQDKAVLVKLNGHIRTEFDEDGVSRFIHEDFLPVLAVPYDMPIMGYKNNTVNTLRLWSAESVDNSFDFASFSRGDYVNAVSGKYSVEAISEVLYPDDSNYTNRLLRLKQQYFFVSAGIQSIVRRFKLKQHDLDLLPERIAIHINDTHPALAVPELMRILIDDDGFGWDHAWDITTRTIAYTNHTIMPEALETWPIDLFWELLPRIYMIVEEINRRLLLDLNEKYPDDMGKVARMSIIGDGVVRMANLAVVGSFSVNGVAAVHTELLKNVVMKDFHDYYPEKFNNKTNGITHRRWLIKSNPRLEDAISEVIGDNWITNPVELENLGDFADDTSMQERIFDIKRAGKILLAKHIKDTQGVTVDPSSIFDVQIKRIHAYKRQLLNALHIQYLYNTLLENPNTDMTPRTFIFAGKAAPSYYYAKAVIKYINELARLVENEKCVRDKLRVVFLENYNVSLAELIFPASDISEQISTASKEASGTGNMKFMMNGAVTIGTNDGANIEIRELVGDDNFILFGLSVEEVLSYYANGGYNSHEIYESNPHVKKLLDQIKNGDIFPYAAIDDFATIVHSLLDYNDEFFVLRDFDEYANAQNRIDALYKQRARWSSMSVRNIAMSGHFSSDNTIDQYAKDIWRIGRQTPEEIIAPSEGR